MIAKLTVSFMSLLLSTAVTIWVMISGWGLSAHNWNVIVWGMVLQFVLIFLMQAANASEST